MAIQYIFDLIVVDCTQATSLVNDFLIAIDLSMYLDVARYPYIPDLDCPSFFFPDCLPDTRPYLLDVGIVSQQGSNGLEGGLNVMALWSIKGIGGNDWLQLCCFSNVDNMKTIYRLETSGVDGTIQGNWLSKQKIYVEL